MASIRDIARITGVSPASVSRILNNDPTFRINEASRARVIETAKRLHYSKSQKYPGPKQTDNQLSIALIMRYNKSREITDPYFLNLHKGINEEAKKWHLRIEQPFRIEDDDKNWADLAKFGAVLIEGEMTPAAIKQIQSINPHIIFIDVNTNIHNCNIVRNDFVEETSHILDTLYNLGHKNIVYIGGKSLVLDLDGKIGSEKNDLRELTYLSWMKLQQRPTAVVVGSDPMALGVYKAFSDAGVNIPDDISVVSFDDVDINRFLTPTLSSVYMNTEEMGKTAVRLAKDLITEDIQIPLTITCHSQLNIRDSISKKN